MRCGQTIGSLLLLLLYRYIQRRLGPRAEQHFQASFEFLDAADNIHRVHFRLGQTEEDRETLHADGR